MAIFSRRVLQRLLNENRAFLNKGQAKKHIDSLNAMPEHLGLGYEWEVVLLNVFSKIGNVYHEKKFGSVTPDIYFCSRDNAKCMFIAEILSVSNQGLDAKNPYDRLEKELTKRVREKRINPNKMGLHIGGPYHYTYKGGSKVKLLLPRPANFDREIFNEKYDAFINKITEKPDRRHNYAVIKNEIDVRITYDPNQSGGAGSYPVYTQAFHLTDNTLFPRLEEKAAKLLRANFQGPKGIVLCDGGYDLFHRSSDGRSYSLSEIIKYVIHTRAEISFIIICTVNKERPYKIITEVVKGNSFDNLEFDFLGLFEKVRREFPEAERNTKNAVYFLKGGNPDIGSAFIGGWGMSGHDNAQEIKISARGLLELLAGKINQDSLIGTGRSILKEQNPFNLCLTRGELIQDIRIEKTDRDDDWIVINLKGPDPAISKFV